MYALLDNATETVPEQQDVEENSVLDDSHWRLITRLAGSHSLRFKANLLSVYLSFCLSVMLGLENWLVWQIIHHIFMYIILILSLSLPSHIFFPLFISTLFCSFSLQNILQ